MTAPKDETPGATADLFLVWSVARRFRGAEDVVLSWFVAGRPAASPALPGLPALPPDARVLFRDYAQQGAPRQRILDRYAQELFTAEEARLFAAWLEKGMGMAARFVPVVPPVDPRVNPTGIVPATLGVNLYIPSGASGPRPPVDAWAYYDASRPARALFPSETPGRLLEKGLPFPELERV